MLSTIIGGALGAASSLYGAWASGRAMDKVRASIDKAKDDNEAWYARRYNEDATQRADAQRILAKTEEAIRQANQNAAGTNAVMGGTTESLMAQKSANAQAMADAASQIAAQGDQRKDAIEQQYRANNQAYNTQYQQMQMQRAQNIASAAQAVGKTGAEIAGAFSGKSAKDTDKSTDADKDKETE